MKMMATARDGRSQNSHPSAMVKELLDIADYIASLRDAIAILRANELTRDRLPMVHEELSEVVAATAGATNSIMSTAEAVLALRDGPGYRDAVEAKIYDIFEACTFQDITGQRIAKVAEAMSQLEGRLARFTAAVKARDAAGIDETEADRRKRNESLLLNGPQMGGPATAQDAIDALFA
ncbi:MAG: protein phosphatase CheZ [Methylobacteriaceae bacterium]|jgi:chemotaxis protein CheZ|nr:MULTISPECIES: protein phosphatase CheZ [Methylobacteriaceae]KQO91842.1 chemotaxis protein [Methylobacterium sp. Leaf90]KQO92532.1 chemotaxis protein [Methylobacterium sp. Leaf92]KQP94444.1 chemotaxis protein [Methylobacterium sp. Leaf119]KQQ01208.1 chemotaxis protein [Methylobacterium sp. Leaf121]MBA9068588.1 chemotaxis protein CheZ [Methylobacterium sp. RAS18]MDF9862171.1 chemotaxis protein CheZ [Methylorubrum pseudosasae]MDH6635789.1 chemotaxis protein CheZ [Methylobacterium sp. SuP10 S